MMVKHRFNVLQWFLEIADCRSKVRLHQTSDDSDKDFLDKMKLLKSEIEQFINHLENKLDI